MDKHIVWLSMHESGYNNREEGSEYIYSSTKISKLRIFKICNLKILVLKYIKFYPHIVTHENFKCQMIMYIVRHRYNFPRISM
jgi:hypothetical protein